MRKMNSFSRLPKSFKKSLRYIKQEVTSLEMLENIEKLFNLYISNRKLQLKNNKEKSRG